MAIDNYTSFNASPSTNTKMELAKEVKVQLSNPALLDKIDKLRDLGVAKFIALPQLVVVGD